MKAEAEAFTIVLIAVLIMGLMVLLAITEENNRELRNTIQDLEQELEGLKNTTIDPNECTDWQQLCINTSTTTHHEYICMWTCEKTIEKRVIDSDYNIWGKKMATWRAGYAGTEYEEDALEYTEYCTKILWNDGKTTNPYGNLTEEQKNCM